MDNEINSIEKNQTSELMDLPSGVKTIGVRWIFKIKLNELCEIDKYKARLMAKGYSRQHGINFIEVFVPVARMDTVRMIVALAVKSSYAWQSKHIRVRFHFLRDLVKDGEIELVHYGTQEQVLDLMTKALKLEAFQKLRKKMGMLDFTEVN